MIRGFLGTNNNDTNVTYCSTHTQKIRRMDKQKKTDTILFFSFSNHTFFFSFFNMPFAGNL